MQEMDYANLRERMRDSKLTQKECAGLIGISESQLNGWVCVSPGRNQ